MSPDSTGLLERARAWLADDPDPDTRTELHALIESAPDDPAALAELADRFRGTLRFGTAGLRGRLGAGSNRMNAVVVRRAAAGLAAYLKARGGDAVVVGFDARRKSDLFARDTARVLTGAGVTVQALPRPLPTPVLAYAIRHLGCDAGVMVTASHNPPKDNGYKVYLGDGAQIAPPTDADIAAEIDAVGPVGQLLLGDEWVTLDDEVVDAYQTRVAGLLAPSGPRDVRVAYTPLHGVAGEVLLGAFERAGFPAPAVVPEQAAPDPDFPTVRFPNPEEPGALDLALALGERTGADLVLANDPDGDRCAAAVGGRMLRGDEVGALLAAALLRRDPSPDGAFVTTIVSSSLLGKMAVAAGARYAETLTGFKWITRVEGLRYGYEEALGYCVDPGAVRDKDGIAAALLLTELAAGCKAEGRTLLDLLDDLEREHGVHATDALSVRVDDLARIDAAMRGLRAAPPSWLGGRAVVSYEDLALGVGGLPPTDALRLRLAGGARIVVRPSGTEPKLKCYLEAVQPVGDLAVARGLAADTLARVKADLAPLVSR